MDSFSLSMKADIYWRRGQIHEAVDTMVVVVKAQPKNATFLFRLGRFLQQSDLLDEAYKYFQRAKAADQSFIDPRLSLASTAIDLGKLNEAKAEIGSLRERVSADKRFVLDEIEAKYYLAFGELDAAADLASSALNYHRNAFTLSLMAKVEAAKAERATVDGMNVMAQSHRDTAIRFLREGLKNHPQNVALANQLRALEATGMSA
jgi:tetratricopeptide (TPR) repeat protein